MTCGWVRARLSAWRDLELEASAHRTVSLHVAECPACAAEAQALERSLDLLADRPVLAAPESVATTVFDRLNLEGRSPGFALLVRSPRSARPLMLPSLVPATLVLVLAVTAVGWVNRPTPLPEVVSHSVFEGSLPPSGTEANPLPPIGGIEVPQARTPGLTSPTMLADLGAGSLFVETVVARDGSVSTVRVLEGDAVLAAPVVAYLRQQRFEPARLRGRPVAVSLYRLISRTDVSAPRT